MHDCPNCEMACDCDMEDHYQSAPKHCNHVCDEDEDYDDDDYEDYERENRHLSVY